MKNRSAVAFLLVFALGMLSLPLFAHHGNAAYDYEKTVTIKGVVTDWIFANPHSWVKMDVTDDKGEVRHWILETTAASTPGSGWHKTSLKSGDSITVDVMPAKNGNPIGRVRRVLGPDGSVLIDTHLPSTLNDVPPPTRVEKPAGANADGSR